VNIRKVVALSSLVLFTGAPFAARAGAQNKASDACIQAFIDAYLPKDSVVRVRKVGSTAGHFQVYSRQYTVVLSAQLGGDEGGLVTVRCVATGNGVVLTTRL